MKICVAQVAPVRGDINANIAAAQKWIDRAVGLGANLIIFPELSLTGYEPGLAKELVTTLNDPRFDVFQFISDNAGITIGVGAPLKGQGGITISMILFRPNQ